MADCLVTKLKGTVDDDSLLKMGELRVYVGDYGENDEYPSKSMRVSFNSYPQTVSISGSYFTNINLEDDLGTEISITENILSSGFYTVRAHDVGDDVYISVNNKYELAGFILGGTSSGGYQVTYNKKIAGGLKSLAPCTKMTILYLSGLQDCDDDIEAFADMTALTQLTIAYTDLTGDISSLANCPLTSFIATNSLGITGALSSLTGKSISSLQLGNTGITGNISSLASMTTLSVLRLPSLSGVTGDLSSMSGLSDITVIDISNTGITGNISSLSSITTLQQFMCQYTNVEGNISDLGKCTNLTYLNFSYTQVTGSVESLVQALREAGVTTGSMALYITGSSITYNGTTYTSSGTAELTWGESSIVWNNITVNA